MMRAAAASLLICLALSACGGLGGEPEIIATMAPAEQVKSVWQPDISNGARIFAENCVACHGVSGDGDGELVRAGSVSKPLDMTDATARGAISPLEWFNIISDGNIENLMPPWRDALTEQERWDVALYAYALAYNDGMLAAGERLWREGCVSCDMPDSVPPIFSDDAYAAQLNREQFDDAPNSAEALAAAAYARMRTLESERAATVTVRGQLAQGTAGGVIPPDTPVQLRYGASPHELSLRESVTVADNSFSFADVPLDDDFSYFISAVVGERLFTLSVESGDLALSKTITIYDVSHDPSLVGISRVDLALRPIRMADGDALHVAQTVRYRNDSDKLYTSGRAFDDGREASLLLQAPHEAQIVSGDAGGRYVIVEALETVPDSVIDTLPVTPGSEHDISVEYLLPYAGEVEYLQAFNNRVDAELTVSLPAHLTLAAGDLDLALTESQSGGLNRFSGTLAGATLRFGVSGAVVLTADAVINSDAILIGLVAIGAAGVSLLWLALRRRRRETATPSIDALTRQIADLDAAHDSGQLNHDLWHQRRRELKARLADMIELDQT